MNKDSIDLKEKLKQNGYKLTPQRQAVLEIIIEHNTEHLSSEEIYEYVRTKHPEIGLATVYRTLILLEKINLIYKHNFDDGFSRYELCKQNEDHRHHHLICVKCGRVLEVKEDLLDNLEEQISKENKFKVIDHKVKFYGYCEYCLKE